MSRLGSELTSSGAESQGVARNESRLAGSRLGDIMSEAKKTVQEIEVPRDRYEIQEDSGNMSEAIADSRGWDEPRAVIGDTSYSSGYNISVETLTSGYILRVGCQSIAVESGADVGKLIGMYLTDKTIGSKWMSSDKIIKNFLQEDLQVK